MKRLNSGESKTIFRNISCIVIIDLTKSGRKAWQEEEERRKDTNIVLIHQEQSSTSDLFKVIQDAVSLVLLYRTMSSVGTVSSCTFIVSDVQSIYIPSSMQDWYREVKCWATDRQYSFCQWIPWTKTIRILTRSTWKHRVFHKTCIKHGTNIKIRCIGSTSTLLWRKDWSSIRLDRTLSFLFETLPTYCIPKVVRMDTGEIIFEKSLWITSHASQDFLGTWLNKRIGFRSCSTTRRGNCATIKKFPIKPTNSKPRSW